MSKIWIPIFFQAGAILVALAEVIIPSLGILTIIALALLGYSWYYIIQELSQAAAWSFLVADIILVPVTIKLALMILRISPLTHGKFLPVGSSLDGMAEPNQDLVGKKGIVESQLRPTGKAQIENQLIEVLCEDTVVEKGAEIKVVEVIGNKIIVEPVSKSETTG